LRKRSKNSPPTTSCSMTAAGNTGDNNDVPTVGPGHEATVAVTLSASGRLLARSAHGHLIARLTIATSSYPSVGNAIRARPAPIGRAELEHAAESTQP
jgi:hypothetical protein